jgi:copper(I)-binding protein
MNTRILVRAAVMAIVAATSGAALSQSDRDNAGANIKVEQPWSRATPPGATVAGGYVKLTNTGTVPDRLVGATFARAKTVEIHTMTNDAGIMKMRHLAEGVALPPGATVELKSGGVHLMLLGLEGALKAGETVEGSLRFEKAGSVAVTFSIAPLGAAAPTASDHYGHEHHRH